MIIAKLMGGMGNQMFQWAFAKSLSLKTGTDFKIDLSFLQRRDLGYNFTYRNYDLDIFKLESNFDIDWSNVGSIGEPHFNFSKEVVDLVCSNLNKKSILLDGYWQSPKYFLGYDDEIRKNFQFKNNILELNDERLRLLINDIQNSNSVMINIRRTDYLNTDFHGVMGVDYVNSAINIIKSKVDNPKYFVFSDDIEWCVENIKLENMFIVDHSYKGEKFGDYLQLMKLCKHFIIPNSSFAWWSAWLNNNDDKIVITPKNWFTDDSINTSDLIPSDWIRI